MCMQKPVVKSLLSLQQFTDDFHDDVLGAFCAFICFDQKCKNRRDSVPLDMSGI